VKFVAIPSGNEYAAVQSGQVSAAVLNEPVFTTALLQGAKVIAYPSAAAKDPMGFNFFTSQSWLNANPTTAKSFVAAIDKAVTYANSHPADVRKLAVQNDIPKNVAAKMRLPLFTKTLSPSQLQPMINILLKFKVISKRIDASSVIAKL
jgi:NitT/TauT family transport system substrate-binding protein